MQQRQLASEMLNSLPIYFQIPRKNFQEMRLLITNKIKSGIRTSRLKDIGVMFVDPSVAGILRFICKNRVTESSVMIKWVVEHELADIC